MTGRYPVSIDGVLDEGKRNAFANTDSRLNPSIIGTKGSSRASDRSSYVGNSLNVASSDLRHSSIGGENAASVSQPRRKRGLDPSDPSTWTSSNTSRPRAASENLKAGTTPVTTGRDYETEPVFEEESSKSADQIPEVVLRPAPSQTLDSITEQTSTAPATTHAAVTQEPESPQQPKSLSPSSPRRDEDRLSSFSTVDSDQVTRIMTDGKDEEHVLQDSSEDERSSSEQDEQSPVRERGRTREADRLQEDSSPETTKSEMPKAPEIKGKI